MNRTSARRAISAYFEEPGARLLAGVGLSPNAVTMLGVVGAGGTAYLLSVGYFWAAGLAMLGTGALDLLDGALARATGRVSRFGALLDSVMDRVSEAVVLLGLLVFYINDSSTAGVILVYLALVGSIMVSYLRARSEGLGIECRVGIMTRPERVAALAVGFVVGHWWPPAVLVVLALIAALTMLTAAQRLYHAGRSLGDDNSTAQ